MQRADFSPAVQHQLTQSIEGALCFLPASLPPELPAPSWEFTSRIVEAERAIAELRGLALPNPYLFAQGFARREATSSSQIEGTQSGLRELLLFEVDDETVVATTDAREISNYTKALQHGLDRLREIPLCLNLMLEMHEILLAGDVRGNDKAPGQFRRGPVWIGGRGGSIEDARFVPPPWNEVPPAMNALEQFIHDSSSLPFLVRVATTHYQFEAIHPFPDGNGRIGRLLIPLMLCEQGLLEQPLLYLSAYFEKRRSEYYDRLLRVSQRGEWMEWIEFFLQGVTEEGRDGVRRAKRLLELREEFQARLETRKATNAASRVLDSLFSTPVLSLPKVSKKLNISYNATQAAVNKLVEIGIVKEISGRQRNRLYIAAEILDIIQA